MIFDTRTGLLWQRDVLETMWAAGLQHCEDLSYGGRVDWRLPNVLEVLSIQDYTRQSPTIHSDLFPHIEGFNMWSSTTRIWDMTAWSPSFDSGQQGFTGKEGGLAYTKCVAMGSVPSCSSGDQCESTCYRDINENCVPKRVLGRECNAHNMCESENCQMAPDGNQFCVTEGKCANIGGREMEPGATACYQNASWVCQETGEFQVDDCQCYKDGCSFHNHLCTTEPKDDGTICDPGVGVCKAGTCVRFPYPLPGGFDWTEADAPQSESYPEGCEDDELLPCNSESFDFRWPPDTGYQLCMSESYVGVPCPGEVLAPGCDDESYQCGQDGEYGWDVEYPGWSEDRFPERGVKGEKIVVDTLTGLVWQKGWTGNRNWQQAVAHCNHLETFAGLTDWRMPDAYELVSLLTYSHYYPMSDFPDLPISWFWSATTYPSDTLRSLVMAYDSAYYSNPYKAENYLVKCVTNISNLNNTPNRFYTSNSDGNVIYDTYTGLMWTAPQAEGHNLTWSEALNECDLLDYGGLTDWRLPNAMELYSIANIRRLIHGDFLFRPINHWSSTTLPGNSSGVGAVNFDNMACANFDKNQELPYICVTMSASASCSNDSDCNSDSHCDKYGQCMLKLRNGSFCESDSVCESNNCRFAPDGGLSCVPEGMLCSDGNGGGLMESEKTCFRELSSICVSVSEFVAEDCRCKGGCNLENGQCGESIIVDGELCIDSSGTCHQGRCIPFPYPLPFTFVTPLAVGATLEENFPEDCVEFDSLPCNKGNFAFPWIPDTELLDCYDDTTTIFYPQVPGSQNCTNYCGQDGQYGWRNSGRYAGGNIIPGRFEGTGSQEELISDLWTGLIWTKESQGEMSWQAAVDYCEGLENYEGITGWRLPDEWEFMSLLDYASPDPPSYFSADNTWYWCASSSAETSSASAWAAHIGTGSIELGEKTGIKNVLCVADNEVTIFPEERFYSDGDNGTTVFDTRTGLLWQRGHSPDALTWGEGLAYCEGLDYDGRDDWRLPNILELRSIFDNTRYAPAWDAEVFDTLNGFEDSLFFSSTTDTSEPENYGRAWMVNVRSGELYAGDKSLRDIDGRSFIVRCVVLGP